jgi:hypothetical protein
VRDELAMHNVIKLYSKDKLINKAVY